jgi:cysteine desulfurase
VIYFDNASTTRVSEPVCEAVCEMLREDFANPSSLHHIGFQAEKRLNKAREQVAAAIKAKSEEIYFTSGGTEANNTAVLGAANAYRKTCNRVITTNIEHPSVGDSFKELERQGFEVVVLEADSKGYISAEQLANAVNENTSLVSIMYVNNEVGTVQDIKSLYNAVKQKNSKALFHCDCVQALGKHEINSAWFDLASLSGHKIHAPKGVGALYIKKGVRINSLHFGGGQEKGFRPGTENTAAAVGMGLAAEIAERERKANFEKVALVKRTLLESVQRVGGVSVNGDEVNSSPYILNLSFENVKGNVLLNALDNKGICVAVGSACSSYVKQKKKVVDFLVDGRGISAVRFSFDGDNTVEEAELVGDEVCKAVELLRKFPPR